MIDAADIDWDAVIKVLNARFPKELEIAVLAVKVAELEAAAAERPTAEST